jgi:hypothetical protein
MSRKKEILYFIRQKGKLIKPRSSRIPTPIGFLLAAVPKCLAGESFRRHRAGRRREALDASFPT